jgi:AraC-like DNA-binding protein
MSSPAVASIRFRSADFEEQERFEVFQDLMSATHEVMRLETAASPMQVEFSVWRLNQIAISSGSFSPQSFARPGEVIRRDHIDHFLLFVQGSGTRYCRMGDKEVVLQEHDIHIVDMAQAESSIASTGSSGTLYIPRDLAEEILPTIGMFHGRVLRDNMSNLLARYILDVGKALPYLPATAMAGVTQATMEITAACLQSLTVGSWEMNSAVVLAMRRRVERYIESQLEDPDLTPASVARACDMSRSTLYRMFEPHGGVMVHIKRRRLARIRAILVANVDMRSLAEISEDFGFQSGAHFSREFRREFGVSPSDIRGERPAPVTDDSPSGSRLSLMLRSLGV